MIGLGDGQKTRQEKAMEVGSLTTIAVRWIFGSLYSSTIHFCWITLKLVGFSEESTKKAGFAIDHYNHL